MAETDVQQHDRTEQPTTKRLEDARRRGQVPRSRELSMTLVVLAGAGVLWGGQPYFAQGLTSLFELGLSVPRASVYDASSLTPALLAGSAIGLELLAPLMLAVLAACVGGTVLFGGWVFSVEALQPKLAKLNPLAGLKRIFGWHGLSELAKALAKVALIVAVGYWLLSALTHDFLELGTLTLESGLSRAAWLTAVSFAGLAGSLVLIAAVDVPFQHWQYRRNLKMTRQEYRDEQKETDGRPEVRSRLRSLQRAIATRRMMSDVPKADVVVMNPTHYAVALRYDAASMRAPQVVAKGADLIAMSIRRVAEAHGVPIFEHREFARALYYTSELGKEISPRLYVAVAQVLTYIYQLTGRVANGAKAAASPASRKPPRRPELDIPPDLLENWRAPRGSRSRARA
jgi:flagellar biosynthetic protein FlhB